MRLLYDFADQSIHDKYPTHGWVKNSQDIKLLWFPIMRLLANANNIRTGKISNNLSEPGLTANYQFFNDTLHKIVLSLREIHRLKREIEETKSNSKSTDHWEKLELLPIYIDTVFFHMRILADDLVMSVSPCLFNNYKSISYNFRKFREDMKDQEKCNNNGILCEYDKLRALFEQKTGWFDLIAGKQPKKGVRDSISHRRTKTSCDMSHLGNNKWKLYIHLLSFDSDVDTKQELSSVLTEILSELCNFMTELHVIVDWGEDYNSYDSFATIKVGRNDDLTGFWPKI